MCASTRAARRRLASRASRAATRTTRAPRTPSSPETSSLVATPTVAVTRAVELRSRTGRPRVPARPRRRTRRGSRARRRPRAPARCRRPRALRRPAAPRALPPWLREEGAELVEDPPLDRPQPLGVELAVASGDLVELDVHDAHEPPVATRLERRLGSGGRGAPARLAHGGRVERRIVAQDRPLELAQRRTRLEPVLVAQQRAQVAIAGERVGLAPRPVQREQALGLQPLAQGLRRGEASSSATRSAWRAERELGIDPLLEHREAALLESRDLDLREPRVGELGKRSSRARVPSAVRNVSTATCASPASPVRAAPRPRGARSARRRSRRRLGLAARSPAVA